MNEWKLVRETDGKESLFDSEEEAEQQKEELTPNPFSEDELSVEPAVDSKRQENGSESSDENAGDTTNSAKEPTVVAENQPDEPPERNLSDDPVEWFGDVGEFTYEKNGTTAINKKGLRVLQYWYDIDIPTSEVIVGPEETDQTFARVKAVAEMPDGRTAVANGSAHVERGDDKALLVEMADTRAKSRVLLDITGMGAVAVSELENEL